jgi:hypothetical protein
MQRTNCVYEEPSRLSQGLVIGLSIAVVLMAGWLTVTIVFSNAATTTGEIHTDATASTPAPTYKAGGSRAPEGPRQTTRSNSVHFDWPAEFASSAPTPPRTALPLAPELPATRDSGRSPWPAATAVPTTRAAPPRRQKARVETDAGPRAADPSSFDPADQQR